MPSAIQFLRGPIDSRNWSDGPSRAWGPAWRALEDADPTLPGVHWTLDLRLGGQRIRTATGRVDLRASNGTTQAFMVGLADEIEVEDSYEPGESSGPRSVHLSIPNARVSAQSQIAAGYVLAGSVEIALAATETAYEDRIVVLDGDVTGGVSWGSPLGSTVRLTASDPRETAGLPVTPHVIDSTRFSAATTSALGQRYPYVFNRYDRVPCHLTSYDGGGGGATALVCVPANGLSVNAVYVGGTSYASGHAEYGWSASIRKDELGTEFLGIVFSGTHPWTGEESVEADVTGGADTYAHECVRRLLEGHTTLGRRRIHYGLLGEMQSRMGSITTRLLVNGSGYSTTGSAMEIIEGALLTSYPMISMVTTDGRYGPVVTDARLLTRADLVRGIHLLNRESDVTESDKRSLYNHFSMLYSYDLSADTYQGFASRSPTNSILCSRSAEIVGARHADPVESTEIYDDAIASYVVDWLVFHRSMPNYYVEYAIPLAYLLRLRLGWNVALTDAEQGWTRVTATVTKRLLRRRVGVVGLRLWWPNLAGIGSGSGGTGSASPGTGA